MTPITEQTVVPVELTIAQWQQMLNVLADGPHRVVAPLITVIGNTIQGYVAAQQHTHKMNGAVEEAPQAN